MTNNSAFFLSNNTHQNTTQEKDRLSTVKIALGIIGTILGMIIIGAYFYSFCCEQNQVAPRQPPEPVPEPRPEHEQTPVVTFDDDSDEEPERVPELPPLTSPTQRRTH